MTRFPSIACNGVLTEAIVKNNMQQLQPCNVDITNEAVMVTLYSSYAKDKIIDSYKIKLSTIEIGELRKITIRIMCVKMPVEMFTISDGTKQVSLAKFNKVFGMEIAKPSDMSSLEDIMSAIKTAKENFDNSPIVTSEPYANPASAPNASVQDNGIIYEFSGARGKHLTVYKDKCVIKTKATIGTLLIGNVSDGEKTIYYADCIGVQFKPAGALIGYLQLETASGIMNNKSSNFYNENSFTFELTDVANAKMVEVSSYIKSRIEEYKISKNAPATTIVQNSFSTADEIKKFKELLDMGVITQEEFDAKKKELLGL